jgi:P4 family phage/plasmid primase-like protien
MSSGALRQFLDQFRIADGDRTTVATMTIQTGGKYNIPDAAYPEFLDLMYAYLFKDKGRPMNIIEQPKVLGPKPLVLDLDFRYRRDRALDHPFEMSHIKAFNEKLVEGLNTFFSLSAYPMLRFFVSLRPQAYENKGEIKDGIHIQCPDIVLSFEKQAVLRNWMLGQDAVQEAFKDTGFTNQVHDVYDESCTRKQGWFLYGESKPNIPAYDLKAVHIYKPATDGWTTEPIDHYDARELLELLSIRFGMEPDDNDVKPDTMPLYERLASTSSAPHRAQVTEVPLRQLDLSGEGIHANVLVQDMDACDAGIDGDTCYEDIELVKLFVRTCLDPKRADAYDPWMRLGWCLHNISANPEMFELWMEFSAKSSKFAGNDVAKLRKDWDLGMRKEGDGRRLTIRSLRHWAKEDNPEAFKAILERDLVSFVLHSMAPTHNHVARLMKRMFQDTYRAAVNTRSTDWFEFSSQLHLWKRINQGMALRNHMSVSVADIIAKARDRFKHDPEYNKIEAFASNNKSLEALNITLAQLVDKKRGLHDNNKIDESKQVDAQISDTQAAIEYLTNKQNLQRADVKDKKFSELTELETKLYNCGFKDSVMKECIGLFYEEDFEGKLNSNPLRIGCANGVIRLDAIKPDPANPGKMKPMSKAEGDPYNFFEHGTPEDYVTFQAGRDMPEHEAIHYREYDATDPNQAEIADFFSKLFPRADLRAWVLKLLASCLEGKNREQCYYTFQGVGGNGKSKLVDLMIMTLGDYQSSLQSTALTRKRPESGAANPDIMSIKNKRFIYMQEPDDKEPLNTSRMKQFSGEDAVEARALYGDQDRFKVSGKLFMMCNNLPAINSMDRGTWRRVRLIPFESKFVNPGDKELGQPNVFPKDMNLNAKLKKWRESFFALLVHIYITQYAVSDNGTLEPAPEIVMNESLKYREAFDSYAKFRYGRMRVDRDSDEKVTINDVWRAYRYWYEAVGGAGKKLTQAELNRRLEDEFGKAKEGKFYSGVFVFNTEEDTEAFDEERKLAIIV